MHVTSSREAPINRRGGQTSALLLAKGQFGAEQLAITWVDCPVGSEQPIHRHAGSEQANVIIARHGTMIVGDEERAVAAGTLVFIPPNTEPPSATLVLSRWPSSPPRHRRSIPINSTRHSATSRADRRPLLLAHSRRSMSAKPAVRAWFSGRSRLADQCWALPRPCRVTHDLCECPRSSGPPSHKGCDQFRAGVRSREIASRW
jgi:uncharacterized RmlC-like cupin family protein